MMLRALGVLCVSVVWELPARAASTWTLILWLVLIVWCLWFARLAWRIYGRGDRNAENAEDAEWEEEELGEHWFPAEEERL